MKKIFIGVAAFAMAALITSCEQDAPEINFSQTTTHVSDFSGIIKAITDMTTSLEVKLALINDAIKSQTLSFEQKMEVLNTAIKQGFLDNSTTMTLLNTTISQKMTEMMNTMTTNTATLEAAIKALKSDNGIYRLDGDKQALFIQPTVWEVVKDDMVLYEAIQNTLSSTEPAVTTSQVSEHSCIIAIVKKSSGTPKLLPTWDNTTIEIGGKKQELVKVISMFTSAVYSIDKGGCALGCYEINITDSRGDLVQQYDFNGAAGGDVTLQFYDNGKIVTSGHVQVIMR